MHGEGDWVLAGCFLGCPQWVKRSGALQGPQRPAAHSCSPAVARFSGKPKRSV